MKNLSIAILAIFVPLICSGQIERIKTPREGEFLGTLMLESKNYPKAEACLKRAYDLEKKDSSRFRIALKLISMHTELKDVDAMAGTYEYLLPKLSEKNKILLKVKYAVALIKLKKVEKAKQLLDSASFPDTLKNEDKAKMYYELAQGYRMLNLYEKAGELFIKAGKLASTSKIQASYFGAVCYFPDDPKSDAHKQEVAQWFFKEEVPVSYKELGTRALHGIYMRDEEYDKAIAIKLEYLKNKGAKQGASHYSMAQIYEKKGDVKKAIEYYKIALKDKKLGDYELKNAERKIKILLTRK